MSTPSIQDVIDKAKRYLELGLSQEHAIRRAIEEVKSLLPR